jgi:ankyrin repeat protein
MLHAIKSLDDATVETMLKQRLTGEIALSLNLLPTRDFPSLGPLITAIHHSPTSIVYQLLKNDAFPDTMIATEDVDGTTSLHEAIRTQRTDVLCLLLYHIHKEDGYTPCTNLSHHFQLTPFAQDDRMDRNELDSIYSRADRVMNTGTLVNRNTPLHLAALLSRRRMVQLLLLFGAEVDKRNKLGETPLHLAASMGDLVVMKALLLSNAGIHARDKQDRTPLHRAAASGQQQACHLLVLSRARVFVWDRELKTPLALAVEHGHWNVVNFLEMVQHHTSFLDWIHSHFD